MAAKEAQQAANKGHGLQRYHFDSFARTLVATVLACDPVPENFSFDAVPAGKGKKQKGKKAKASVSKGPEEKRPSHILRVSDTVLFAEGGGQPFDTGLVNNKHRVVRVLRAANAKEHQQVASQSSIDDTIPLHYVSIEDGACFAVGEEVELAVDWERRLYHMQQHSAQHLISAIAESAFGWSTSSWWLGTDKCNIEFLANDFSMPVTDQRLEELEQMANDKIRSALPVDVSLLFEEGPGDSAPPSADFSDRKSKERHQGRATRIVSIDEGRTDANQCCGTHVTNTAQLQCVKLLGLEPARGQVRVFFVAGKHAMDLFSAALNREAAMTALVCTRPDDHARLVSRTMAEHRAMTRDIKGLMAELADFHAQRLIAELSMEGRTHHVVSLHRDVGDTSFASSVATAVTDSCPKAVCFITCGNEPAKGPSHAQEGIFLVASDKSNASFDLQAAGRAVAQAMSARGGGKAPRFQGKAPDLRLRELALDALLATLQ